MVDVIEEKWDANAQTLSGISRVVAGDRYELRIVVPAGEKSWRAEAVSVSADDVAAGVKAELRQDGPGVRAGILSPAGREVRWQVKFAPGRVAAAPSAL
jgi:hypothetical protein